MLNEFRNWVAGKISTQDTSPWSDYWYSPFQAPTAAGKAVTVEGALAVSAVYAATRLIAETVGMLPIFIYKRTGDGGKEPAPGHPLFDLLHNQPNSWQTALEFKEAITAHAVLTGNGYAWIKSGRRGLVDSLWMLDPNRMKVEANGNELQYIYQVEGGEKVTYTQDEIFHLRGFGDGMVGLSVISLARETIGLTMAAEEHGAKYFSNGAEVGGVMAHPQTLSKEAHERLSKGLQRKHSGTANAYKTLILEEGMTWQRVGLSNEDSQFIQSRKFQLNEIARWFRLPPHMLGDLERATFSNIEMQAIEFVTYSMLPWLIRWRQAISRDLIARPDVYFADFKLEQLLRGDSKTRYESYQIAINNGILSPNEVRTLENLNAREGGDKYWRPLNFTTDEGDFAPPAPPPAPTPPPPPPGNGAPKGETMAIAKALVEKEIETVTKRAVQYANDQKKWEKAVREYYGRHAKKIATALCISEETAKVYCHDQIDIMLSGGLTSAGRYKPYNVEMLAKLAAGAENVEKI